MMHVMLGVFGSGYVSKNRSRDLAELGFGKVSGFDCIESSTIYLGANSGCFGFTIYW